MTSVSGLLPFPNNLVFLSNVTMVTKLVQLALLGA